MEASAPKRESWILRSGGGLSPYGVGANSQALPTVSRKYTVRLGDHSLLSKPDQEISVARSIQHPCFNHSNNEDHSHDLMLIRLSKQAALGPKVKPINLAKQCARVGQKCTISGWGTVTSPRGRGLSHP